MVSSTMTAGDALDQLRAAGLTDDLARVFRRACMVVGYRNVARAVASLARKDKPATATAPAHVMTEADQEYITALESQLVEAETFFQEFPMLQNPPIRTVHRFHARKGIYAKGASWGPTEQITVGSTLADRLRERGRAVEYNKRTGLWWADVEDEAWGRDVNLEELFGARAGSAGYEFDDVLPMYRRAVAFKANIPYIQAEIARVQVEGA